MNALAVDIATEYDDFADIPELVAQKAHDASESSFSWTELKPEDRKDKCSKAKKRLNSTAVLSMTPELLNVIDPQDEVRKWLREIGQLHLQD